MENRPVDKVGEGGGRMNWESRMETYIALCEIDSQWDLLHDAGSSNWGSMTA